MDDLSSLCRQPCTSSFTLYATVSLTDCIVHPSSVGAGLLLRIFSYWYDMDVIEEESFFKWKEDVPQEYPGKGQALFQVLYLCSSSLTLQSLVFENLTVCEISIYRISRDSEI